MKIHVRNGHGELEFPSFADFQKMYLLGFVAADDQVRRESSERWVRAGDLPELRSVERNRRELEWEYRIKMGVWLALGGLCLVVASRYVGLW